MSSSCDKNLMTVIQITVSLLGNSRFIDSHDVRTRKVNISFQGSRQEDESGGKMGYPQYATGVGTMCMRVIKMKPMTIVRHGDGKSIKILVSELNPPVRAIIKELAQGGSYGTVPISFASRFTLARTCPPPPCPCKPCVELTPRQKAIKYAILGSKIAFLGGTLAVMWFLGVLGPTWETWHLKECVKTMYFACNGIEYKYRDKCKDPEPPKEGPACYSRETSWNTMVIFVITALQTLYYGLSGKMKRLLDYESCEYVKPVKEPPPKKEKKKPEEKVDYKQIYRKMFGDLDPSNLDCGDRPDYYGMFMKQKEQQ